MTGENSERTVYKGGSKVKVEHPGASYGYKLLNTTPGLKWQGEGGDADGTWPWKRDQPAEAKASWREAQPLPTRAWQAGSQGR